MTTRNETKRTQVKKGLFYFAVAAALALTTSFSRAADEQVGRATVEHAIQVKAVTGSAQYAYDSTGWRPLTAGKVLHAGASVRTSNDSSVVLAMEEHGSLVRVGPMRRLELAKAAPAHESGVTIVPLQARIEKAAANAPVVAER
jgi:hypothetical protein